MDRTPPSACTEPAIPPEPEPTRPRRRRRRSRTSRRRSRPHRRRPADPRSRSRSPRATSRGAPSRFHDEATADLLDELEGTVFALGDNVQGPGTREDFANCFEPSWGRHKVTHLGRPWETTSTTCAGAVPHFEYWGERAGPAGKGYYSFDLGDWRIIVLNSNLLFEEQNQWLAGRPRRQSAPVHARLLAPSVVHLQRIPRPGGAQAVRRDPR